MELIKMSPEQEIEYLRGQLAKMRQSQAARVRLKVSEKGALSVYGLQRWPVTLYKEQWRKLLEIKGEILAFIEANEEELAEKE